MMSDSAGAPNEPSADAGPTLFKKKTQRNRDVRSRQPAPAEASSPSSPSSLAGPSQHRQDQAHDGDDYDAEPARSEVVLKRKAPSGANPLVQRTAGAASLAQKRQRLEYGDDADDGGDDDDCSRIGTVDRFGERTIHSSAMRKVGDGSQADLVQSSRDRAREDATRGRNWNGADGEEDGDGAGAGKAGALSRLSKDDPEAADDGLYRGLSAYKSHAPELRDDGSSSKFRAKGPIKPTANIRTISVVDYQPDVCKDYKETGYCGFGDTCKFLHDRSDYLAGWQLALVPEAYSSGKRRDDVSLGLLESTADDLNEEDEEIPFACLICRQPFTEPVVTRCGHYFCMSCAIKRYAKNPKCFACGKPTNGIFNAASKILERMEKKREMKAEALRERRRAWDQADEGEEQTSGEILEGVEIG
ncbi:hypothetical protein V8E36_001416 [Tilletia maclaganii]